MWLLAVTLVAVDATCSYTGCWCDYLQLNSLLLLLPLQVSQRHDRLDCADPGGLGVHHLGRDLPCTVSVELLEALRARLTRTKTSCSVTSLSVHTARTVPVYEPNARALGPV